MNLGDMIQEMPPHLKPIAKFIADKNFRLSLDGVLYAVRLVREGTKLAGQVITEPEVAFFTAEGNLAHRWPVEKFAKEFNLDLPDQTSAIQDEHEPAMAAWPGSILSS